jgi:hypothetical protein
MFQRCESSCDQYPEPENDLMHLMESRFDEHLFLKRSNLKLCIFTTTESPVRLLQNAKRADPLQEIETNAKLFPSG